MPRDPKAILRALRNYRAAMSALSQSAKADGVIDIAARRTIQMIDSMARYLTGNPAYFSESTLPPSPAKANRDGNE